MKQKFIVKTQQMLSEWINEFAPHISYNILQKSLRKKDIVVRSSQITDQSNVSSGKFKDKRYTPQDMLYPGDEVHIWEYLMRQSYAEPADTRHLTKYSNLKIIDETDDYVIIDKQAGMASQGGTGVKFALLDVLRDQYNINGYIVHRLDKDVSGLMLVAKNVHAARELSRSLREMRWSKKYIAILDADCVSIEDFMQLRCGIMSPDCGIGILQRQNGAKNEDMNVVDHNSTDNVYAEDLYNAHVHSSKRYNSSFNKGLNYGDADSYSHNDYENCLKNRDDHLIYGYDNLSHASENAHCNAHIAKSHMITKSGVIEDEIDGQYAKTKYWFVHATDIGPVVELEPVTGRKHQLRIHCAKHLAPIVDDDKYDQSQRHTIKFGATTGRAKSDIMHASTAHQCDDVYASGTSDVSDKINTSNAPVDKMMNPNYISSDKIHTNNINDDANGARCDVHDVCNTSPDAVVTSASDVDVAKSASVNRDAKNAYDLHALHNARGIKLRCVYLKFQMYEKFYEYVLR